MTMQSEYQFAAEEIKASLLAEIDNLDKQIGRVKEMAKNTLSLSENIKLKGKVKELQQRRDEKVRNFFNNQDAALEVFGATL